MEADLLADEGDVESELVEAVDGDLEADLSGLEPEELEEEPLEATGEIDVSQLNQDIDVEIEEEDWDDEEDEDESEALSPKDKIMNFINDLKGKFAKKKNKTDDEEDEDEDLQETKTEIDPDAVAASLSGKDKIIAQIGAKVPALKGLLGKLNKKKSSNDEDDEDFDPDEVSPITYATDDDEPPKKKFKVIHGVILVIAVFGLFYEDIFPPEQPVPAPKLKARAKPVKKKKPAEPAAPKEPVAPAKDRTAEQIKEVGTINKNELASDTELPVDTGAAKPTTETLDETPAVEEQPTTTAQTPSSAPAEDSMDDLFDENTADTQLEVPTKEEEVPEEKPAEVTNNETNDSQDNQVEEVDAFEDMGGDDTAVVSGTGQVEPGLTLTQGQLGDDVVGGTPNQDITKSILQDLEVKIQANKKREKITGNVRPTDPPTYEINGRGLVYNCAGKHWACTDSISFKTCEGNYAWNSSQGKAVECYPVQLFNSSEKCEDTQQKKIDNVAETDFCNF